MPNYYTPTKKKQLLILLSKQLRWLLGEWGMEGVQEQSHGACVADMVAQRNGENWANHLDHVDKDEL